MMVRHTLAAGCVLGAMMLAQQSHAEVIGTSEEIRILTEAGQWAVDTLQADDLVGHVARIVAEFDLLAVRKGRGIEDALERMQLYEKQLAPLGVHYFDGWNARFVNYQSSSSKISIKLKLVDEMGESMTVPQKGWPVYLFGGFDATSETIQKIQRMDMGQRYKISGYIIASGEAAVCPGAMRWPATMPQCRVFITDMTVR